MQKSENRKMTEDEIVINNAMITKTLSHHPKLITYIFNLYGLNFFLDYFLQHAGTPWFVVNSYHNPKNSICTTMNAYEGALFHHLETKEIQLLLVATLFMYYKHDCVYKHDRFNTKNAVEGFKKAFDENPDKDKLPEFFAFDVCTLIRSANKMRHSKMIEKIILDASNMVIYQPHEECLELYKGLYSEANDHEQQSVDRFVFTLQWKLDKLAWFTQWGRCKAVVKNYPIIKSWLYNELLHFH